MGSEEATGTREKVGNRKGGAGQNCQLQLTLVMAPESLILGFLGVEVFELSKVPDPVPQ